MSSSAAIAEIEGALVAHWSLFGRSPGATLHEDEHLTWFETPVRHLPYNAVIRTHAPEGDAADEVIDATLAHLRKRGVDFMWFDHPSARPRDLRRRLEERGLGLVETATGMSLELQGWRSPGGNGTATIERVEGGPALSEYTELSLAYWEVEEPAERAKVTEIHRFLSPERVPGHRYLARLDGVAVGKAYLSLGGPPGVAAINGMSVVPEARGRGIAGELTTALIADAAAAGFKRVVLHSSEMAVGLYTRAGFVERCEIGVYATASIWSHEH